MNQIEKLQRLADRDGFQLAGVTLGDNPGTPEDVANAIRRIIILGKRTNDWGRDIDLSY